MPTDSTGTRLRRGRLDVGRQRGARRDRTSPSRWSSHFGDLETMRAGRVRVRERGAAGDRRDLQLAAAAGNAADFNLQSFFAGAHRDRRVDRRPGPGRGAGGQRGLVGGLGDLLDAALGLPDGDLELPDDVRRAARPSSRPRRTRWPRRSSSQRQQVLRRSGSARPGRPAALARNLGARHRRDAEREPPGLRVADLPGAAADHVLRAT